MSECPLCEGALRRKTVPYELYGIEIGRYPAKACQKCGEVWFDEETSERMTEAVKARGLWGLERKVKVTSSGGGLNIRIPKPLQRYLRLRKGRQVTVRPGGKDQIIIELN